MVKRMLLFLAGGLGGAIGVWQLWPQASGLPPATMAGGIERTGGSPGDVRGSTAIGDTAETDDAIDAAWARQTLQDPVGALRAALDLGSPAERDRMVRQIVMTWADLDPESFLAYAVTADDVEMLRPGLVLLIPTEPARVFEIASRLPMDGNLTRGSNLVQMAAVEALASRDPAAAAALVESKASEGARYNLLRSVAAEWGRADPDAALAWADGLAADAAVERAVEDVVIAAISADDFDRGFALYAERNTSASFLWAEMVRQLLADPKNTAVAASRLLDMRVGQGEPLLFNLVTSWAARDPDTAMDWLIEHTDRVDAALTRAVALSLASRDLDTALGEIDRLTPALRQTWIVQLARPYAEQDPVAALDWIDGYRGTRAYDYAYTQIVMEAASSNPEFAMQRFDSLNADLQVAAAPAIAESLARQDIVAAADWVSRLSGPARESRALDALINAWSSVDPAAAGNWVLGLPHGAMRDAGIIRLMNGRSRDRFDLLRLVDEIDGADRIPEARLLAAFGLADTDPDRARTLVETYLDDAGDIGMSARSLVDRLDDTQR